MPSINREGGVFMLTPYIFRIVSDVVFFERMLSSLCIVEGHTAFFLEWEQRQVFLFYEFVFF